MTLAAQRTRALLEQAWLPILLIVIWYFASAASTNPFLPPLSRIWESFLVELTTGDLIAHTVASMRNIVAGLFLGVVVGIVVGIAIGKSRALRSILNPYLQFARSVPQVALVPIIIGALGITALPKIWAIAFACIWPVLLNTVDGVRAIDPGVRDLVKSYRIGTRLELFKVVLPAALPQMMAGMRISLSVAVVVMVVSEIYGATEGIGYFINYSKGLFQPESTWMGTLLVGLLGYLLSVLFLVIEKRALHWYHASAE
ncbi:ABC transporter permease [Pseudoclavibacter endophyticus]|uniref:ABC transporter permease subunit n=1 Tax=Pseudoclavibacter endophyticus TaxID=1778590 RepID=A0A6H9WAN9_9MICO|nr:ABC transporter permease subunit [Pseudoclavibacter endophyticus]KAB1646907.1 ABC transporter permease subunit [Pseudoclavibacter endophyticus]GGA74534.1 ABC transporter permease [Pseudoclavibacter endophyticus]